MMKTKKKKKLLKMLKVWKPNLTLPNLILTKLYNLMAQEEEENEDDDDQDLEGMEV
jgi:hypothetical protein